MACRLEYLHQSSPQGCLMLTVHAPNAGPAPGMGSVPLMQRKPGDVRSRYVDTMSSG